MILSFFKYVFAALFSIKLGFLSEPIDQKNIFNMIILFLLLELSVFADHKSKQKQAPNKQLIINSAIPQIFSAFLIFILIYRYGYGNTFGILGYEKPMGVLTILNFPFEACILGVFISYVCLWSLICVKSASAFRKITVVIIAILGAIAFFGCLILYISKHHLYDSLMILTLFIYAALRFVIFQINNIRETDKQR